MPTVIGDPNLQQLNGIQPNNTIPFYGPIPPNGSQPCPTPMTSSMPPNYESLQQQQQQKPSNDDINNPSKTNTNHISYPRDSFNLRNY